MKKTIGVFLVALLAQTTAHGQAQAVKCVNMIRSLDVPITTSGTWCLAKTLTGTGLVIDASNVTIEMRGYSIINSQVAQGGSNYQTWSQVGIKSENDDNIRIRNGNIVGFDFGVRIGYPHGGRGTMSVESVFVRDSKQVGIDIIGRDEITVVNNVVSDTIGPVARGMMVWGPWGSANASVITVEGNRVDNTRSEGTTSVPWRGATGIFVFQGANTMVVGNTVTDVTSSESGFDVTGINVGSRHPHLINIINNTVLNSTILNVTPGINTFGVSVTQGGDPSYAGPLGTGLVSGTKVYGYDYGIYEQSDLWVNGEHTILASVNFANNLVSGSHPSRAYIRGIMGKNNRVE